MKATIRRALPGEDSFELGEKVGAIIWAPGAQAYVIQTEDQGLRALLEPLLKAPMSLRSGGQTAGKEATRLESVKPGDAKFLVAVRERLLEHGYWLELESDGAAGSP